MNKKHSGLSLSYRHKRNNNRNGKRGDFMSFCRKCGTELREGARFCPSCGAPVSDVPTEQAQQAAPGEVQPIPKAAPAQDAQPAQTYPQAAPQQQSDQQQGYQQPYQPQQPNPLAQILKKNFCGLFPKNFGGWLDIIAFAAAAIGTKLSLSFALQKLNISSLILGIAAIVILLFNPKPLSSKGLRAASFILGCIAIICAIVGIVIVNSIYGYIGSFFD